MALGAVQSGYAKTSYAYQRTTTMTEEFYSAISSSAQVTEEKNDSRVIGLAMIPYGNSNVSYGMKAQYAPESTKDNPVIQVTSNYGGQNVSYKVNVNEVDPRDASQLEMFALLSYSDDQGISDGGSFGSYHKMKVYADNAQMNGYWEGNGDWDSFLGAKHDWLALMTQMLDDYSQAGVYSQFLNCQKLVGTMSHFNLQHIDFDNLKIVDKSSEAFFHYELKVPPSIWGAWLEAAAERGEEGIGNDMLSHLSSKMRQRFLKHQSGGGAGLSEKGAIEAALQAAREALNDLEYPLAKELERTPEVQKELEEERALYLSFIRKLEEIQEGDKSTQKTPNPSDISDEEKKNMDFVQLIREKLKEIHALIQSGAAEQTYQIGSSSFTLKEWKEFLEKFDSMEDAIKELMRREQESMDEKEEMEGVNALMSESTKSTYPSADVNGKAVMYVTWYTEKGIFCRKAGQKAGQREGYEWSVLFKNKEDYTRVMEFLKSFDARDNLRFAANESFWQDFLNYGINTDGFVKYFKGISRKASGDSAPGEDAVITDADRAAWEKYMSPKVSA